MIVRMYVCNTVTSVKHVSYNPFAAGNTLVCDRNISSRGMLSPSKSPSFRSCVDIGDLNDDISRKFTKPGDCLQNVHTVIRS